MSKIPEITIAFWLIKILATTLGETGGDAVSMTLELGYATSTAIFFSIFLICVTAQVAAKSFHRFLYWSVIVATTTAGTTMADYADRSLGLEYVGGVIILLTLLMSSLGLWRFCLGSVSVARINSPKVESFYWITILFSNTLGTALGDFTADSSGLGYDGSTLVFLTILSFIAIAYYYTKISRTLLFWAGFILTRPLGAVVGDLLTKPLHDGGLDLSRLSSSAVIATAMIIGIVLSPKTSCTLKQY